MKKQTLSIVAGLIVIVLSVTGCGQSNSFAKKKDETQAKVANVKDGLSQLLSSSKNLKTAINQDNTKKVKAIGPELEEEWSIFEDQIKSNDPSFYTEVENDLDPTIAGTKVDPIDKKTLLPLVDHLIQVVQDLSKKVE